MAALYLLHRLLQGASGGRARIVPYDFYAQPVAGVSIQVRGDPNSVIETVEADSRLLSSFPRPPEIIAARFAAGAHCHAACVKGSFAGYIWIATGSWNEDEVRCRYELPSRNCVWDFDVYVAPDHRLGRTLSRLWQEVNASLAKQGVEWSYSRISRFNPGSISAHTRLGATRVARGLFIVFGTMEIAFLSLFPFIHVGRARFVPIRLPLPKSM